MARKIVYFLLLILVMFLIAYPLIKENNRDPVKFSIEGDTKSMFRFRPQLPTHGDGVYVIHVRVTNIISRGSKVTIDRGGLSEKLTPNIFNHIFTITSLDTNSEILSVNFSENQEIFCRQNPNSGDNFGRQQLDYTLGFVFSDSIKNFPYWSTEINPAKLKVFGEGFTEDDELTESAKKKEQVSVISGRFNTDSLWAFDLPMDLIDIRGLPILQDTGKSGKKISSLPSIDFKTLKKDYSFLLYISDARLVDFDGSVYTEGKKYECKNSSVYLAKLLEAGYLTATITAGNFHLTVRGSSDELEIDDQNIIDTKGSLFARDHPLLIGLATAVISAILISLVVTKGKSFLAWLFPRRSNSNS